MPKIEISHIIKAPRAKVWEVVSDPEAAPKYDKNTISIEVHSREGNTIIMTRTSILGGQETKTKDKWTLYPQEKIETESLEGPADVKGIQLFEEVSEGTKATLAYDISFKGIIGKTMGRLLAGPKLQEFADDAIESMAKYIEAQ
jgi:carbon monoxide dehydrogenase subunit G